MTRNDLVESMARAIAKATVADDPFFKEDGDADWEDYLPEANATLDLALEEAMRAAYSPDSQRYTAGNERDDNGLCPPGSPYDRGRYDARAAIRALKEEKS